VQRGGGGQGCARGAQRQSPCASSASRGAGTSCRALKPGDALPGWAKLAASAAPVRVQAQRAGGLPMPLLPGAWEIPGPGISTASAPGPVLPGRRRCAAARLRPLASPAGAAAQVPECYKGPVLRRVHFATARLDELCARLLAAFAGRWVPGEGALALRDGAPAACRVVAALDPAPDPPPAPGAAAPDDARAPSGSPPSDAGGEPGAENPEASDPAAPPSPTPPAPPPPEQAAYRVHWLARDGAGTGAGAVLRGGQLERRGPPLTRELLKAWLPAAAECEAVKARPCAVPRPGLRAGRAGGPAWCRVQCVKRRGIAQRWLCMPGARASAQSVAVGGRRARARQRPAGAAESAAAVGLGAWRRADAGTDRRRGARSDKAAARILSKPHRGLPSLAGRQGPALHLARDAGAGRALRPADRPALRAGAPPRSAGRRAAPGLPACHACAAHPAEGEDWLGASTGMTASLEYRRTRMSSPQRQVTGKQCREERCKSRARFTHGREPGAQGRRAGGAPGRAA
jgi:hypothetical protein